MGLKTFSLMMLVFNMAFLRPEEVAWILSWITPTARASQVSTAPTRQRPEAVAK